MNCGEQGHYIYFSVEGAQNAEIGVLVVPKIIFFPRTTMVDGTFQQILYIESFKGVRLGLNLFNVGQI